jgi:hypothetical protein
MIGFVLALALSGACPEACRGECLLTGPSSVERAVESAEVVATVASVDVSVKAAKRFGSGRRARVVARLERRLAKLKSG